MFDKDRLDIPPIKLPPCVTKDSLLTAVLGLEKGRWRIKLKQHLPRKSLPFPTENTCSWHVICRQDLRLHVCLIALDAADCLKLHAAGFQSSSNVT